MNASALTSKLLKELDRQLTPLGFEFKTDPFYGDRFYRRVARGRHGIHVAIGTGDEGIEVQLAVTVRFDAVEDLVARFERPHPLITEESVSARSTITVQICDLGVVPGDPLSRWGGENRKIWTVKTTENIEESAQDMTAYALEKGAPFFAMLSNPDEMLLLLSGDDAASRSYSGPDEMRAQQATALALLLHGETAARQMANLKSGRLKRKSRAEFSRWVEEVFKAHVPSSLASG